MNYESIMKLPIIGQIIVNGIEDGRKWGQSYLEDSRWCGVQDKMANHAIYESVIWSVGEGVASGIVGVAGITLDVVSTLYSQVKLTSTLFTIYGIDTNSPETKPLILAAAAGVSLSELANKLGTRATSKAIQKALMSVPGKTFVQINKALGIKLISKVGENTLVNVAKIMPLIGGAVGGTVNAVMMNTCGYLAIAFIKAYQSS